MGVACCEFLVVYRPEDDVLKLQGVGDFGMWVSTGDILVLTFEASQLPRDATPAFSPVTLIDSLASTPREHLVDHRSTAMATLQYRN